MAHNAPRYSAPGFTLDVRECRVAIDLLVRKGRVGLKDLEKAGHHSSAHAGLILTFLAEYVMLVKLFTRRLLLRLRRPRVHIGGLEREGEEMFRAVAEAGGGYLLMSYYYVRQTPRGRDGGPPAWKRHAAKFEQEILKDCGMFSFEQERRRAIKKGQVTPPLDLESLCDAYCDCLIAEGAEPYTYIALDVMGNPLATRRLLIRMLQRGLRPIPVFHYHPRWREGVGWDELYWLWKQGFDVLALGNSVGVPEAERREWAAEVMRRVPASRQNYHGLGFGSLTVALLPFYSADATTHKVGRQIKSKKGTKGGRVLTDFGQLKSAVGDREAVKLNIRYQVGVGERFSLSGGGIQKRMDELLDQRADLTAFAT